MSVTVITPGLGLKGGGVVLLLFMSVGWVAANTLEDKMNARIAQEQRETEVAEPEIVSAPEPVARSTFALTVKPVPEDATVSIRNIAPKYFDGMELKPGRYKVRVEARGYKQNERWVTLDEEDLILDVVLEKQPERRPFEPEMVKIPGKNYSMGKYEVTVSEYLACVTAKGCREPEWRERGSVYNINTGTNNLYKRLGNALTAGNHPIVGVSWHDATQFAQWLSDQTGKKYRLPTEQEWEHAARAGSQSDYPWGNDIGRNRANCGGCGSRWDNKSTSPVGSFAAYGGLHDTVGNVWEWTSSFYSGSSGSRVLRGGSWDFIPAAARSAYRYRGKPYSRVSVVGFRLHRTP